VDLALHGEAASVLLADADPAAAEESARAVDQAAGRRVAQASAGDAGRDKVLDGWLEGADACLSALPYSFNPAMARACLRAGCHHADLGGDPITVSEVLAMNDEAAAQGVSLVPDCGLAPGLANVLTARALELAAEKAGSDPPGGWKVRVRCGGLPVEPSGPLDYALVFSPWGLLKEYDGEARVVRGGKVGRVRALEGLEEILFEGPPGRCEAFHTVGGASTMPDSFGPWLHEFDYKTVRYPGHCDRVRLLADLGLVSEEPLMPEGGTEPVIPRHLLYTLLERSLPTGVPDLVVLRVEVEGEGLERPVRLEIREFSDEKLGLSAMERGTGFPAAAVLHDQARGEVPPGASPPERAVRAKDHLKAVEARGIRIAVTV